MTDGEDALAATREGAEQNDRAPGRSDIVGTALLGAVGLVAVVMGLGYGFSQDNGQVGPGFLPVMTGGFIVVASVLELVRMFVAPRSSVAGGLMETVERVEAEALSALSSHTAGEGDAATSDGLDTFGRTHAQSRTAVVMIFAAMFAAILLTPVIGLLLSMSLMTFVILRFIEGKGWLISLAVSLVALAAFFLIFKQALGVPLPAGMLGLV